MAESKVSINDRKVRMGMVGGGEGAFIGAVHRKGALMDGQIELVCGAFDEVPEKGRAFGVKELFLDPARSYGTYQEMARAEASLREGERMDFVSIVTPNHVHFPMAKAFLEAGFHVVCEKPMTVSLEQALELREVVRKSGKVFVLTHNYTGYPMVKHAKAMVETGKLGKVMKVIVQYPQGWLLNRVELEGLRQAVWRTDPKQAGPAGSLGDIGSHCANLVHYITGLEIESLCADVTTFAPGRLLDDDVNVLIRYAGGARGTLQCSQVCAGEENNLSISVYGRNMALEWKQEHPNYLNVSHPGAPVQVFSRGSDYLSPMARLATRLPTGHPEAFIESFANIYLGAAASIRAAETGEGPEERLDHPGIEDGVRGMAFIETVLESGRSESKWTPFRKY
ncbi:MAG: Gfo/Idh/MocA family oxidoreductase [Gemmatimonadota bacterium]|nr:Gfo/Idh/MocA family oxidoreductase [Gemmatimonadota bacterium]